MFKKGDIVEYQFNNVQFFDILESDKEGSLVQGRNNREIFRYPNEMLKRIYFHKSQKTEDFGEVHESETGSKRYNSGKPEFHHLSPEFLKELMDLMTKSASKYGDLNWALGQNLSTPLDSMMRHYLDFAAGEDNDAESGKSHLLHIAANAMIAWYSLENYPELDDRFLKRLEKLRK